LFVIYRTKRRSVVDVRFHGGPLTEAVIGLSVAARGGTPTWCETEDLPALGREAIDAVGDPTGEVWLHLLGLALAIDDDADPGELVTAVEHLTPSVLMAHVVGLHVPAWHEVVAGDDLEAAADGDRAAALRLLAAPRYYGGVAGRALPTLLDAGPDRAKELVVHALDRWVTDVVLPRRDRLASLHAEVDRTFPEDESALETVERVAGLRFEPEPYTDEVVLVPQLASPGGRVLAQHDRVRIIVYDATGDERDELEVLAAVFAALGEVRRLELLRLLGERPSGVSDLARAAGLAKSTTHQHLALLRAAGVIGLAGQAWRYRYEVRPDRVRHAAARLIDLLDGATTGPNSGQERNGT
jgi:DNA-binding transcriptional ArsR family regulator